MSSRPIHYVLVNVFSLVAAWTLFVLLAWRSTSAEMSGPFWILASLFMGWILADFASGLVHWSMDTWGGTNTPIIGKMLIHPFREHHDDPREMTRHNYFEVNGHNAMVLLLVLVLALFFPPASMAGYALLLSFSFGILMTNQIHKWSHLEHRPAYVRFLQSTRIILPANYHALHHTVPYMKAYSITNGWLSPFLDQIGFFRWAEYLISRITGWRPRSEN